MPKELIVSVNGREKKIAVVEDGRVTEFYIERGEGGQGIVGNIYKGRVMRVLPGMQSAFVDIGLERDAFLYVSDFFDEEEEFERIVVDRSKTDGQDAARAAATERVERARVERERAAESAFEEAEGGAAETDEEEEEAAPEEFMSAVAAAGGRITEEVPAPVAAAAETEEPEGERRGRRRRGRGREEEREQRGAAGQSAAPSRSFEEEVRARTISREEIDTPFAAPAAGFERVADDEEAGAVANGEMFKDARVQERILDQIHAVEFDMDDAASAPVGSLLGGASAAPSGFERVADDDADEEMPRAVRSVQPAVAASVASLAESLDAVAGETGGAQSFERVSDDEKATEGAAAEAAGGGSKKRGTAKKGATKSASKSASKRASKSAESGEESGEESAPAKGAAKKSAAKKSAAKGGASKGRARKSAANESGEGEDAEASVTTRAPRGEFARRGGRRRRRGGRPEGAEGGENGETTDGSNGHAEEVGAAEEFEAAPEVEAMETDVAVEAVEAAPVEVPAEPARAPRQPRGEGRREGRGGREANRDGGREGARESRGGRDVQTREARGGERGERPERPGDRGGRDNREARGGRDGRDGRSSGGDRGREGQGQGQAQGREPRGGGGRRGAPLITDLLREGQEILVQIAKEPISQKGARITSHIALPGRYLVYMPTVEHVGVSRKIESDSERQRLRKLIKDIRETEDVPSGGFIVRTAGVGITEENLRDDARYLVRTWRDIRRDAEKKKAAAIVHADLGLVQRLLRDQLSEEFTAIRVDSETEYKDIVEFVNRIQPKLVNRVKLYTRDEPILENYGVQAEIEKAIKPRVWLRSGGYLVINQTEALVAIDVNTGKFVGRGGSRLEDTITKTNLEAVDEIARQIRLRDLGGIIVLDLIDMEDRRNRNRVMAALQDALREDKSPTKVLSFNDFGLVIMTRKRVKQSLERTLCSPCPYCTGAGLVKSPQTVCYEILEEARRLSRGIEDGDVKQTTLRVHPEVERALRSTERDVYAELEDYLGAIDLTSDAHIHQEQFDFAFV